MPYANDTILRLPDGTYCVAIDMGWMSWTARGRLHVRGSQIVDWLDANATQVAVQVAVQAAWTTRVATLEQAQADFDAAQNEPQRDAARQAYADALALAIEVP